MEAQIDSHQWVGKVEMQYLFSGKPDLKLEAHTQTADGEPAPRLTSRPRRIGSLFNRVVTKDKRT